MATFVADLSDFLIPKISNYTPDFGTMLERGLQTKEVSENIAYPLLAQRGFTVTETSDTTQILRDSVFLMQTADTKLTLGSGQEGIKVAVYNQSEGEVTVQCNTDSTGNYDEYTIQASGGLQFRYVGGKWIVLVEITDIEIADGSETLGGVATTITFKYSDGTEKTVALYNANGIESFVQTEESDVAGGRNAWRVTLNDGQTIDMVTYNGKGIKSFVQTESSAEPGGRNTWEVTLDDDEVIEMTVLNGAGITNVEVVNTTEPLGENTLTVTTSDGRTVQLVTINGNGITSVEVNNTTEPLGVNTATFTMADGDTKTLESINGNGITSVEVENTTEPLGVNKATFTMADGDVKTLESVNGNSLTVAETTEESTEPLGRNTVHFETADGKEIDLTAINGNGVVSVEQTDSDEKGGENTLTITWADGTVNKLVARNGVDTVGVDSIEQTESSSESGGKNVWHVILVDGTEFDIVLYNGKSDDLFLGVTIDPNGSSYFSFRGKNYVVGMNTFMAINLETLEVERQTELSVQDGYVYAGICDTQIDLSDFDLTLDENTSLFGFIGEKGSGLLTQRTITGEPFIGNLSLQASLNQEGLNIEKWS